MKRKNSLILIMLLALIMTCCFGCKTNESNTPVGDDTGNTQTEDMDVDVGGDGTQIDFDDLLNAGAGEEEKDDDASENGKPEEDEPENNKSEEGKPDDNKTEDNDPEDSKPEDNKPEDNKPEDNKPEDNKPEDNKPEDEKPDNNEPEQGDNQEHSGVIENEDTDVDVPI